MSPVILRRLVPADLADYKRLRDAALNAHPEAFSSDAEPDRPAESYRGRLGENKPAGGEFTLGAWQGEQLQGAVTCERDPRPKLHHIGHLIGMIVSTESRRLGIGRRLLTACIEEARAASGLVMLTLTVTAGNAAALHLYERAGFRRCGRLERAICVDGVYHAKDQMTLDLDRGV